MSLSKAVLWLDALGFAGFGVAFALWPDTMARLIDLDLPTDNARIDIAATYGGLELGVAAFLVYCAASAARVRVGLLAGALAYGGLAGVRLGWIVARGFAATPLLVTALAIEASLALLSFWAARRTGRAAASVWMRS